MLTIRFTRKGKKNQPSFRIVVVDKRQSSKAGSFIEDLGFFNPLTKKRGVNKERAQYWISVGAKASPTVHNLLVTEKIITEPKVKIKMKKMEAKAPETATAPASSESAPEARKPDKSPEGHFDGPSTIPPKADLGGAPPETPAEPAK